MVSDCTVEIVTLVKKTSCPELYFLAAGRGKGRALKNLNIRVLCFLNGYRVDSCFFITCPAYRTHRNKEYVMKTINHKKTIISLTAAAMFSFALALSAHASGTEATAKKVTEEASKSAVEQATSEVVDNAKDQAIGVAKDQANQVVDSTAEKATEALTKKSTEEAAGAATDAAKAASD